MEVFIFDRIFRTIQLRFDAFNIYQYRSGHGVGLDLRVCVEKF